MSSPALVLVGPTATGKSGLAIELARRRGRCEIVSADSMQVYRGMDIGTAKAGEAERDAVPHHLLDLVEPAEHYTVARFVVDADTAMADIAGRGNRAILVGGTGLYVQAFVDRFDIPDRFPVIRAELEAQPDTEALWARLRTLDPLAAGRMDPANRRRVLRALEVCVGSGRPFSSFGPGVDRYPPTAHVLVGLDVERASLDRRIDQRVDAQMRAGFLDEVRGLLADGIGATARQALGYRELIAHLDGVVSLDEAVDDAKRRIHRFARRQQRWFRRDPRIHWIDAEANPVEEVHRLLEHWSPTSNDSAVHRCT